MLLVTSVLTLCALASAGDPFNGTIADNKPVPCTCGVFLSGQFKKGSKEQPKGVPVLTQEMDTPCMNNAMGNRQCTNRCLEMVREWPLSGPAGVESAAGCGVGLMGLSSRSSRTCPRAPPSSAPPWTGNWCTRSAPISSSRTTVTSGRAPTCRQGGSSAAGTTSPTSAPSVEPRT
jgi:hypothetical protein